MSKVHAPHLAWIRRIDEESFARIAPESRYQVIGLRNIISHWYETIAVGHIWDMIADDLPVLAANLTALDDD